MGKKRVSLETFSDNSIRPRRVYRASSPERLKYGEMPAIVRGIQDPEACSKFSGKTQVSAQRCSHAGPEPASLAVKLVNHLCLNGAVDIFRHRIANLFANVSHCSQSSSDQGECLGYLPRQPHV
jgi:hypothetical protein